MEIFLRYPVLGGTISLVHYAPTFEEHRKNVNRIVSLMYQFVHGTKRKTNEIKFLMLASLDIILKLFSLKDYHT